MHRSKACVEEETTVKIVAEVEVMDQTESTQNKDTMTNMGAQTKSQTR